MSFQVKSIQPKELNVSELFFVMHVRQFVHVFISIQVDSFNLQFYLIQFYQFCIIKARNEEIFFIQEFQLVQVNQGPIIFTFDHLNIL